MFNRLKKKDQKSWKKTKISPLIFILDKTISMYNKPLFICKISKKNKVDISLMN